MADQARHYRWDDLPREELNPLLGRRLVTGGDMMIAQVYLAKYRVGGLVKREIRILEKKLI